MDHGRGWKDDSGGICEVVGRKGDDPEIEGPEGVHYSAGDPFGSGSGVGEGERIRARCTPCRSIPAFEAIRKNRSKSIEL